MRAGWCIYLPVQRTQACASGCRATAQRGPQQIFLVHRVTAHTLSYARAFPPQLATQIASRPTLCSVSMNTTMTVRSSTRPVVAAAPSRPAFRAPRAVVRPRLYARAGPPTVRSLPRRTMSDPGLIQSCALATGVAELTQRRVVSHARPRTPQHLLVRTAYAEHPSTVGACCSLSSCFRSEIRPQTPHAPPALARHGA